MLPESIRSIDEIFIAEAEYSDKVWYDRHQLLMERAKEKKEKIDLEIWKKAQEAAKKIEKEYGKKYLGPHDDFEWGMINGKLSAIRWVLGEEWDVLDT